MVAKFKTGSSLKGALNYNERKVQKGAAACLHVENFPMDHDRLSFSDKLRWLQRYADLNTNVKANSVHISLNFDPSEKLSTDTLKNIAASYMQQIGFGDQPYLVYNHNDAGHPHIHIVSVKVNENGRRMDTQNIGRNQSEAARKNIEIAFNLVPAALRSRQSLSEAPLKVQYGKSEIKRAISNVLAYVLPQYRFSSLHELNAVLKLYNVIADRGAEQSRMFQRRGLVYRALDEKGKKIGVGVKASTFYMQPTLAKLEALFIQNETLKKPLRERTRIAIDRALLGIKETTVNDLIMLLKAQNIRCILRQNENGRIYGITYVDVKNKVVFNGSDLGKTYSANGMLERYRISQGHRSQMPSNKQASQDKLFPVEKQETLPPFTQKQTSDDSLIDLLTQTEDGYTPVPFPLKKTRKKKKKGKRL